MAAEELITWDETPDDIGRAVRIYCDTLPCRIAEGAGMVLAGRAGAGKTCLLRLICEAASQASISWSLFRAPVLFNLLFRDRWEDYQESEAALLLIDDLGTEYPSDFPTSRFVDLMLKRHGQHRSVVIATNLSESDLEARPGMERIVSRLRERGPYLWTRREDQRKPVLVRDWMQEWEGAQ